MRLGVSLFGIDGGRSGISRYAISLLDEMVDLDPSIEFELLGFDADKHLFPAHRANVCWLSAGDREPSALRSNAMHQLVVPRLARRRGWDALFLPAANRRSLLWAPCPRLGTIHDFSSLHVDGKYDPARMIYIKHVLPYLSRRLEGVVSVSESTAADVVRYARVDARRVSVVPNAVDHDTFFPVAQAEARHRVERWVGQRPFALYLSRIEHPGKNHVRLIRAYESLRSSGRIQQRLVLCGGDWNGAEEVHRAAAESKFAEDIVLTGFVPAECLRDLYCASDALVFPSLFEGFGLPILEAMACGVPVACSNVSSMPEVAGSAAELFDPADLKDIGHAMLTVLADPRRRATLRHSGLERSRLFTWRRSAAETLTRLLNLAEAAADTGLGRSAQSVQKAVIR